MQFKTRDSV